MIRAIVFAAMLCACAPCDPSFAEADTCVANVYTDDAGVKRAVLMNANGWGEVTMSDVWPGWLVKGASINADYEVVAPGRIRILQFTPANNSISWCANVTWRFIGEQAE